MHSEESSLVLNPLTMNDEYSHHQNSAACCQLAQSVLKIDSALAERVHCKHILVVLTAEWLP